MTTITDIFHAFAPESLERSPNLPDSHQKAINAIQQCRSGRYGHSLYQCQSCGKHHRVNHSCGNRHCPQCQHHTTQLWLHHQLEKQLPGPHFLITFTVPETLRPFIRSHQRLAYHAMFKASATALKRLAQENASSGPPYPALRVSCTPGAGNSSFIPTSTTLSPAAAFPRTPRSGYPHAPTSLSLSKRFRPSTALSSKRRYNRLNSCHLSTRRSGTCPGTSTARPIQTATPPSNISPRMSSKWPSPTAASCASRTVRSPSPTGKLEAHAHAPPRSTPLNLSAGSSSMFCPMAL